MKEYLYLVVTDQARGTGAVCLRGIFQVFSGIYALLTRALRFLYARGVIPQYGLDRPVISVGNITLGGVGKTPLVVAIAEFLASRKVKPAILIRGYMTRRGQGYSNTEAASDEAMLLRAKLPGTPVVVGKDRVKSARQLRREHAADVFLLDDGFQHWRVKRDLDIVAIDATNPFGNGHLIPRGFLREPLSALQRADCFVLTKTDLAPHLSEVKERLKAIKDVPIIESVHRPQGLEDLADGTLYDCDWIRSKPVCSFCAIGDPRSFEKTLQGLGAVIKKHFFFIDHHWYDHRDLQRMADYCQRHTIAFLVTTQKDAVKLNEHIGLFQGKLRCLVLKIAMDFRNGRELFDGINHLLQR